MLRVVEIATISRHYAHTFHKFPSHTRTQKPTKENWLFFSTLNWMSSNFLLNYRRLFHVILIIYIFHLIAICFYTENRVGSSFWLKLFLYSHSFRHRFFLTSLFLSSHAHVIYSKYVGSHLTWIRLMRSALKHISIKNEMKQEKNWIDIREMPPENRCMSEFVWQIHVTFA